METSQSKSLSSAAQAVMDAVALSMEGGWISPEFVPYEARKIAAALLAVADQVVPSVPFDRRYITVGRWNALDDIRAELLAIAAELEGPNG